MHVTDPTTSKMSAHQGSHISPSAFAALGAAAAAAAPSIIPQPGANVTLTAARVDANDEAVESCRKSYLRMIERQ